MNDDRISCETLLALGSTSCLLVMKYYEAFFYYRNINLFIDTVYSFVAIPLFYFLITGCFTTIFIKQFNLHISKIAKRTYKLIDIVLLIIYMICLILKLLGFINVGFMPFISMYWIPFIVWGIIFGVDFNIQ